MIRFDNFSKVVKSATNNPFLRCKSIGSRHCGYKIANYNMIITTTSPFFMVYLSSARVVGENTNGGGNGGTAEFPVRDINRWNGWCALINFVFLRRGGLKPWAMLSALCEGYWWKHRHGGMHSPIGDWLLLRRRQSLRRTYLSCVRVVTGNSGINYYIFYFIVKIL